MKKYASVALVIMFLTGIFTPLCLWLLTADRERSSFEKRRLLPIPVCDVRDWQSLLSFPQRMEKYYEDHFGLRDQLIAFQNLIHVKLFKRSPNASVTLGLENWLFYNADHCLADFFGLWKVDREQLEHWRRILRDRKTWLSDRDIHYLVMIVPTKMMVYPHYLPRRIRFFTGATVMEDFFRYVRERDGGAGLVNLLEVLRADGDEPSYFRTDTHWNGEGAYRAYLMTMKSVRSRYPDIKLLAGNQRVVNRIKFSGDLSTLLNLSGSLTEHGVAVSIKNPCSREVPTNDNNAFVTVETDCVDSSHTLLMIHDSYGQYIRPYFDETFKKIFYTHSPLPQVKELIAREAPSVIVDQRAARYFSRMLVEDQEITSYVMWKHLRESEDLRLHIKADDDSRHIKSSKHLRISHGGDGIQLQAIGDDPFIELIFPHEPVPDSFLVHVELTSPVETTMQFFYTTDENRNFSPDRVVSRLIKKGYNELLFRLPHPDIHGRIRFDPGTDKGMYTLHSLRIKGERYDI